MCSVKFILEMQRHDTFRKLVIFSMDRSPKLSQSWNIAVKLERSQRTSCAISLSAKCIECLLQMSFVTPRVLKKQNKLLKLYLLNVISLKLIDNISMTLSANQVLNFQSSLTCNCLYLPLMTLITIFLGCRLVLVKAFLHLLQLISLPGKLMFSTIS